ncbi:MAG: putative intracellular protease/amidase [Pseudohongiellaceae bacterium]|jgi:putative intracellular protease/amidase
MIINCLLFDRLTTLDAIGPMTVLSRLPDVEVNYIGLQKGLIRSVESKLGLMIDHNLSSAPGCDILIVPGGPGIRDLLHNQPLLTFIKNTCDSAKWTASICTGSLLLGAAGLLQGKKATTHWNVLNDLKKYGATPVSERVVIEGNLIMGAGVAAGIDMALTLSSMIESEKTARAIQLKIEYDPAPPFNGGSPSKESTEVIALARGGLQAKVNKRSSSN